MRPIHVGIPVSYDYKYLPLCLSRIYDKADKITLAIDKARKTWAGQKYEFDESFLKEILDNDPLHKISLYEDTFSVVGLGTLDCDLRERRMIREFMNSADENAWHLQLDSDEYFVNFEAFVRYLHALDECYDGNITVNCQWVTILKLLNDGILIAGDDDSLGFFPVASIGGCRWCSSSDAIVVNADFKVLHQSWGRDEKEIHYKISNWGHNHDFDVESYFQFWESVNRYNAPYIRDCHPLGRKCGWNWLEYREGTIPEILNEIQASEIAPVFKRGVIRRAKMEKLMSSIKKTLKNVIGKR